MKMLRLNLEPNFSRPFFDLGAIDYSKSDICKSN